MYLHVGISSDYLLFRRQIGALLELEIAYCARQGQVTVDTAKVDKATCGLDACLFGYTVVSGDRMILA